MGFWGVSSGLLKAWSSLGSSLCLGCAASRLRLPNLRASPLQPQKKTPPRPEMPTYSDKCIRHLVAVGASRALYHGP